MIFKYSAQKEAAEAVEGGVDLKEFYTGRVQVNVVGDKFNETMPAVWGNMNSDRFHNLSLWLGGQMEVALSKTQSVIDMHKLSARLQGSYGPGAGSPLTADILGLDFRQWLRGP